MQKEEMIEFTKDWTTCWKKGDRFSRASRPQFAATVIATGYGKALKMPPRNKMIEKPEVMK